MHHESRNESIKTREKKRVPPHINLDRDTISVTGEETGAPRRLLNLEHSLSAINAPETQSTCHLQSPQDYHSICFFIDCHSTLIMWLIKTNCRRPSTVSHVMNETAHQPDSNYSRCLVFIIITQHSSTPHTHIYCISCTLSSHQEKPHFSFFLSIFSAFFLLNLIFRVN